MYRYTETSQTTAEDFEFPMGLRLDKNNRWVILSDLIPWQQFEKKYATIFDEKIGAPAKPFRMALGALIIQKIQGITDQETIAQIKENPYLQSFIGLNIYENKAPFHSSMLVHFRKRITPEIIEKINQEIVLVALEKENNENEINKSNEDNKAENKGQLILDASAIPSDIAYPTDLRLLNQGREKLEKYIDKLYKPLKKKEGKKPRTDRKEARNSYLEIAKKRKTTRKQIRRGIKKQLKYVERNLGYIKELINRESSLNLLTKKERENLEVIKELYRQQKWMYEEKKQSIENRIVSIEQPYIRPIVRGKAGKSVEFGAKISISYISGYAFLDYVEWENFNESKYLVEQVEKYYKYMGYYPESIHVDKIYRTRENRKYCREKGIRMSGPKLGRPPKNISKEEKKQANLDEKIRNRVEGIFGVVKRRYGLNLIKTKLKETSETTIAMGFLVMNLMSLLSKVLKGLFWRFWQKQLKSAVLNKVNLYIRVISQSFGDTFKSVIYMV